MYVVHCSEDTRCPHLAVAKAERLRHNSNQSSSGEALGSPRGKASLGEILRWCRGWTGLESLPQMSAPITL